MSLAVPEELFERHHGVIYRFLLRMTERIEVAEDLTQEVFLRVIQHMDTYQAQGRERAWLFKIARNLLLDHRRQSVRRPEQADEAPAASEPPTQFLSACLEESLRSLPESDREVFLLREVAGLSYDEIASVCSVTIDAVRSRIYRVRSELRAQLAPELNRARKIGKRKVNP
jgi:RNA polymerase sigma-70 factor (ECF subfamily)